jgi:hypothetical protein
MVVVVGRHLFHRPGLDHTGIVDQHVHRSESLANQRQHRADLPLVGDVAGEREELGARGL